MTIALQYGATYHRLLTHLCRDHWYGSCARLDLVLEMDCAWQALGLHPYFQIRLAAAHFSPSLPFLLLSAPSLCPSPSSLLKHQFVHIYQFQPS